MFASHIKIFLYAICLLGPSVSSSMESNCIESLLSSQQFDETHLHEIKFSPGSAWFKDGDTILEPPKHDYEFIKSSYTNTTNSYYFDLSARKGYLQHRGGLAGKVAWFGPFELNDGFISCIKTNMQSDQERKQEKMRQSGLKN